MQELKKKKKKPSSPKSMPFPQAWITLNMQGRKLCLLCCGKLINLLRIQALKLLLTKKLYG